MEIRYFVMSSYYAGPRKSLLEVPIQLMGKEVGASAQSSNLRDLRTEADFSSVT